MSATKGVPLSKDEVVLLIDLVEANKVIFSKVTNASNNKLKEAAWERVTNSFNATISSCPRRMEQLKLKWENLKKTARKRSTKIRLNQIKTGGGKPEYITPDDALDRVASILGATCEGYTVPFGDAEEVHDNGDGGGGWYGGGDSGGGVSGGGDSGGGDSGGDGTATIELGAVVPEALGEGPSHGQKKFFFQTPSGNNNKQKRKLLDEDIRARTARNTAIAEYYIKKSKKLDLEIKILESTLNNK